MKKLSTVLLLALTLCFCANLNAAWSDQWSRSDYLPGRAIVNFDESIGSRIPMDRGKGVVELGLPEIDELFEEFEVTSARRLVPDGILDKLLIVSNVYNSYVIEFRNEYAVLGVVDRLQSNKYVTNAEPDLLRRMSRTPNDALWQQQWDKRLLGADFVWDVSTGNSDIICAGIDTGVDFAHPDLRPILWVNPGEDIDGDASTGIWDDYAGDTDDLNGVDDDENGYEDDFLGWDFIRNINNCATGEDCDNFMDNNMYGVNSHGTHIGGTMAADGDNGIGMSGFVWEGTLMALRAGYEDQTGQGYMPQSATVPAIYYAVANGASIINMSYGGPGSSSEAANCMASAWNNGAILFAASGNDGSTSSDNYPANYEHVIAVNATTNTDWLIPFSNRGPWTDMCAPGVDVLGTIVGGGYDQWSGTSMASPTAAGCAALVWSVFPDLTNAELRELLEETCVDITAQNTVPANHLGHGRISASNAVASRYPRLTILSVFLNDENGGDGDNRLERGESGELYISVRNMPDWALAEGISVTISVENEELGITNGTFSLGNIPAGQSANNNNSPVTISAATTIDTAFWADLTFSFHSTNGYAEDQHAVIRIERGDVLIIDDDDGANYQSFYGTALDGIDVVSAYDIWTPNLDGAITQSEMLDYSIVIWECGNDEVGTLNNDEQTALAGYLDNGGNLIMVGQGLDEDISETAFYADYLHAELDNDQTTHSQMYGIDGTLSEGMSLLLLGGGCGGNGTVSPTRIVPVNGGEALFTYGPGGIGAVTFEGSYKLAYFGFALESACGLNSTTHYSVVLQELINWMWTVDTPSKPTEALPITAALHGCYPNPFNSSTAIRFDLTAPMNVRLTVFDLLGREAATLVDGPVAAGAHSVKFDGSGLASGMYIVRLEADAQVFTSKMMLLK
ncbi:S8 family serine peptidase [bacterium]|nr:S8 family serine peptidase [bacterium]